MSESSYESEGDVVLVPITQFDDEDDSMHVDHHSDGDEDMDHRGVDIPKSLDSQKAISLRQRRLSKSMTPLEALKLNSLPDSNKNFTRAQTRWLRAIQRSRSLGDPWAEFHLDELETESCLRHRYSSLKQKWTTDEVHVKIGKKEFNRGAMRACFRLKKLSSFTHGSDWQHAANYVAKRYITEVDREVYFQDVKLQMDAKVWGEEFNRHNPPKKVDIFQMCIIEFKERKDSPLYHLEHFIEGEYIKYNSNSGFVEENLRHTPHAFSHFTFERSGHSLIVVDVQGVGDLYTDPQIHTIDGKEYGDGNLGAKGMALYFHSHICNDICRSLGLTEFDLSSREINFHRDFLRKVQKKNMCAAKTAIRGKEEICMSASPGGTTVDITCFLGRLRSTSSCNSVESAYETSPDDEPMSVDSPVGHVYGRFRSTSESDSASMTREEEELFRQRAQQRAKPSCVNFEKELRMMSSLRIGDSILGKIHHEMAKYHEMGRFAMSDDEIDWESALFHEEHAAELGELEAIVTLAKLYLGMEKDVLVNCTLQNNDENVNRGIDYMVQAAEAGDRNSMVYMARAFETGDALGSNRSISWEDAVYWYEQAVNTSDNDEGGEYDCTMNDPIYTLQAKQAEMYRPGGHGLDKDPQRAGDLYTEAAEGAMAGMKGRLANKYFALAEECWGEVEEAD